MKQTELEERIKKDTVQEFVKLLLKNVYPLPLPKGMEVDKGIFFINNNQIKYLENEYLKGETNGKNNM